jgi:hypothetical protein
MPKCANLGELITALYDAASELDDGEANAIVAVATIDVLLRQRRRRLLAELVEHGGARSS